MSEFQLYDFRTIDRPLTSSERQTVSGWSSRSKVSTTKAVFTYSYGDFSKNVEEVVAQYFDMALYLSSYGMRQIVFRFPLKDIDYKALSAFDIDASEATSCTTGIEIRKKGDYALVNIEYNDDDSGGWIDEDDSSLDDFISLRDDILRGDYRSLFVVWLQMAYMVNRTDLYDDDDDNEYDGDDDEGLEMPPVPANLKTISGAISGFMDFFGVDEDLVAAAAEFSENSKTVEPNFEKALLQLDEKEKTDWLLRLLKGETRLEASLKKRLSQFQTEDIKSSKKVTLNQVLALVGEKESERKAQAAVDAHNAHVKKMNDLAKKEANLWISVENDLKSSSYKQHDEAVQTLKDLHEMALYFNKKADFLTKFKPIVDIFSGSKAKISRMVKAGLPFSDL